jgi:hypothetical protein
MPGYIWHVDCNTQIVTLCVDGVVYTLLNGGSTDDRC